MADLQKLFFETPATVSDREVMVTARLNARVSAFAGCDLFDDLAEEISEAVTDEMERLVAEGILSERPRLACGHLPKASLRRFRSPGRAPAQPRTERPRRLFVVRGDCMISAYGEGHKCARSNEGIA